MTVKFLREGKSVIPEDSGNIIKFCSQSGVDLTLEWFDGQYLLHSDLAGERPIGIEIDQELERHIMYFKKSSLHRELLARAIGIKGGVRPKVMDLTAGLLGDSLLFLSMGCEVIAIERHPVIAFLIRSALVKAKHPYLQKFIFNEGEASEILKSRPEVDVLFFDPMFEDANQKSLPRKEMRIFRGLVGEDLDSREVFNFAHSLEVRRLVVKRPRLSVTVIPGNPLQYIGKATRYDVYLGQKHGPIESNLLK
ncbi:MAG TPA: class I SAM-dependent methyltransferase [Bacteriovoracaceae bacterium]|nr:class I SAM-dependent methyltransferase [Bacteriovoracaceae bacterium]